MSKDPYPVFDILDAELQELTATKPFPQPEHSKQDWDSAAPLEGKEQWEIVRQKWAAPDWDGEGGEGHVQEEFRGRLGAGTGLGCGTQPVGEDTQVGE